MANLLTNFLGATFGPVGDMYNYQHASRLYREDNLYDYTPKAGWIYYVELGLSDAAKKTVAAVNPGWASRQLPVVGILAKTVDQPRFTIATETLNQYNKKAIIQKGITYQPLGITWHDDQANASTDLWTSYYKYYYADGNYTGSKSSGDSFTTNNEAWSRTTKFGSGYDGTQEKPFRYGLNMAQSEKFFENIVIYQLYKKRYTKLTLINPMVTEWNHSQLDQSSSKLLDNKMTVAFEAVTYETGKLNKTLITGNHYDTTPSPISIGGVLGVAGASADLFADISENGVKSPFDLIRYGIAGASIAKNASKITAASVKAEAYSVLSSGLGAVARGGQSGNIGGNFISGVQQNVPGAAANLFTQYTKTNAGPQATQVKTGP
jgi:hypothetical protein